MAATLLRVVVAVACGNNDGLYTIFISNVCICNSNINSSDFLL